MNITPTTGASESTLMQALYKLTDAGGSVIQVRTREPIRAAVTLRKNLLGSEAPYHEWDAVNGFRRFTTENFADHQVTGDKSDFIAAMEAPLAALRSQTSEVVRVHDKVHHYVFMNPVPFMKNNPYIAELITQYAAILPSTNVCLIFITADESLPDITPGLALVCDLPTPNAEELHTVLVRVVEDALRDKESFPDGSDITEEDARQIAHLGLGLSMLEFETHAAISIIDASLAKDQSIRAEVLMEGIGKGKMAVIRESEILELTHTTDISDVGGMKRLKDWLGERATSYSDEAREFGVEAAKGIALVGVPGTGKSLVAKACASVLGVPLVRFDIARVFSKYVGDSEQRVRAALKMVESMAPCVLFVDEIDKGLGGASGGGDSGTSSRVLGTFLTWLQDCKAPVFTMVTANRTDGLPPELLRRGRFDQIFSVGMPSPDGCAEVLAIHLRKRGRSIDDFQLAEIAQFKEAVVGYVPAEIESAVKDAITAAFNDKTTDKLEMRHILRALSEMVPMSRSNAAAIAKIVEWATHNATPVEYTAEMPDHKALAASAAPRPTGRVIRPRR